MFKETEIKNYSELEINEEINDFLKPRHYLKGFWSFKLDQYEKHKLNMEIVSPKEIETNKEIYVGKKRKNKQLF